MCSVQPHLVFLAADKRHKWLNIDMFEIPWSFGSRLFGRETLDRNSIRGHEKKKKLKTGIIHTLFSL